MRTKPGIGRKLIAATFAGIPFGIMLLIRIMITAPLELLNLRTIPIVKWLLMTSNKLFMTIIPFWLRLLGVKVTLIGDDPKPCAKDYTVVICNHRSELDSPLLEAISTSLGCYPAQIVGDNGQWYTWLQRQRGLFAFRKGDTNISEKLAEYMKHKIFPGYDWLILFPEGGLFRQMKEKSDQFAIKNKLPVYKNVSTPRTSGFETIIKSVGETKEEAESGTVFGHRIKWVLDVTLVYQKSGLELSHLINETVPEDAQVNIVSKLYKASEIPRDDEEIKNWLFERYQEKDDIIEHFLATGNMPNIKGRYTTLTDPFKFGSLELFMALMVYTFTLYKYIFSPFIQTIF